MNFNSQEYELEMAKARKEIALSVIQNYKFRQCNCDGTPRPPHVDVEYLLMVIDKLQSQIKIF